MSKYKVPAIHPGDKVGLVAPAGPVKIEQVQDGLNLFREIGIEYELGKYALEDIGIVSASAEKRIEDIHTFLRRDDIKAIWALRGGYGSVQLLEKIDYQLIKQNPKLFLGFSDITALQWGLYRKTGLPSFSGFPLTLQFTTENPHLKTGLEMLSGEKITLTEDDFPGQALQTVVPGISRGILIGGTLSMICSLCGTPYFVNAKDLILYIEDVSEPIYRIDRCFQQLKLMDFWQRVNGVILGQFLWEDHSVDVTPLLLPMLGTSTPVIANFPYAHRVPCIPLPQGVPAEINSNSFQLRWERFLF